MESVLLPELQNLRADTFQARFRSLCTAGEMANRGYAEVLAAQGYGTQLTLPGLTLPELLEWGTVPGHAKLLMRSFFVSAQLGCFDSSNAVPVEPMHGSSAEGARTPIEFRIQAGITNVIDSEERFVSGAQQCQCGYSALYSSASVALSTSVALSVALSVAPTGFIICRLRVVFAVRCTSRFGCAISRANC